MYIYVLTSCVDMFRESPESDWSIPGNCMRLARALHCLDDLKDWDGNGTYNAIQLPFYHGHDRKFILYVSPGLIDYQWHNKEYVVSDVSLPWLGDDIMPRDGKLIFWSNP